MNFKKIDLKILSNLKPGKSGSHKNALTYPHPGFTVESLPTYASPLVSDHPLFSQTGKKQSQAGWLDEQRELQEKERELTLTRLLHPYQLIFEKYDSVATRLLMDLAGAAHWTRLRPNMDKVARILKKQGEQINGWGWVVYRMHSSGEAVLPDQTEPANYTLFNFWQISFNHAFNPDLSPDMRHWHLHAYDTLEDFERLMPGEVERWLKDQLYRMYSGGCLWVALPDQINEKGKRSKPTIQDALHTYNVFSFGRNYDPYQTEAHFYDRPPLNNQFSPGFFKR